MSAEEAVSYAAATLKNSGAPAAEEATLLYRTQSARGKQRTLVPAWRVAFSNGSLVTIDAFTGDVLEGR